MQAPSSAETSVSFRPAAGGWYAVPLFSTEPLAVRHTRRERLPFRVRVAAGDDDLRRVAHLRYDAYARHLPAALTQGLLQPDPLDREPGVAVLMAESKVDGELLGTLRIQTNRHRPLVLEQSYTLPAEMAQAPCAEVTRLAVAQQAESRLVKTVLLKAAYLWCERQGVRYVLVTARSPLDRQYARLMFRDVDPAQGFVPLAHVFGLPHRVMYCDIGRARHDGAGHPLYPFWFETDHPDIDLGDEAGADVGSPSTRSTSDSSSSGGWVLR
ncbi:hypothetical protein Tsedi_00906 [Tepidimonas sediminis]|uniref:N-acetyltransferase domain-containing protein n=1 Tax=Tepidimonas sediminis TaxID=2588941 RepID=A0A554WRA3_9BURK|nr:hypothetical protein [Tepidimonas sediminis]TSE26093.1 hypothetical protein Tsedi_00906 [Tepidimonas sediminis]